ncbi:MAG TPA: PAS domain-containing protein, partial [Pyrinomonadaceae bacterium]|nr:PAS domain-containing protein [Pyrinomonadaceae bacterium]
MSDAGAAFAKKLTSSERTPEDVFRRVSGHLGPFFHASVVVFAKAAEDPGNFEVVYQWTGAEADGHGERIALKSFIDAGQFDMLTLGTPVSIEDRDETISINAETINGPAVGSYIVIPYLVGGQLAYVLGLFRADPARWQPDEVRILSDASENVFTRYERTLAQVALARSIMFDEAVLGNIAEGLCTLDRSGRLLTINPAGEQILGWTFSELRGSELHDKVHHGCPSNGVGRGTECSLLKALAQGAGAVDQDDVFIRKDGAAVGIRYSVSPLPENGETAGSIVVFRDVSERKAVETRLRESEARFAKFMQNLPGLAWIKDSDGRYAYANDAAEKAFRTPRESLYGKSDFEVFDEELARTFVKNDRDALENGSLQTVEVLEDENGLPRYSIVNKFAIPIDGANPLVGGIAIDITEQKRAQEDQEFLFSISEAIRVSREPDRLLAYISDALGKYLKVHRCLFNEIDLEKDTEIVRSNYSRTGESIAGRHKVSDYSPLASANMESGQTVVNRDSKTDPRTAEFYEKTYAPNKELAYITVPMLRGGKWVASLWCSDDKTRDWTMREVALVENIAERAWSAVERLRSEELLRRSQEMFSTLVEAAPFGVYSIDSDFRLISVNTGAQAVFRGIEPLIGRDFAEILRLVWTEPFATETIEKFRHTLKTGEPYLSPTVTEYRAGQTQTETYDWQIHRITLTDGTFGVVCYFYDLTHQKHLEGEVRRTAAMDGYRLKLADALRPLADPLEIQFRAACVLGEYVSADRVGYAEDCGDGKTVSITRNYVNGVPGIEGVYRYDDYAKDLPAKLLKGRTVVRPDIANDGSLTAAQKQACAALQLGATANRPLVKEGCLVGMLFIHYTEAHDWSQDELALLEETAERTWAAVERARAIQRERDLTKQLETIINGTPFMLTRCGRDLRYTFVSVAYAEMVGLSPSEIAGRPIVEVLGAESFRVIQPYIKEVLQGRVVQFESSLKLPRGERRDLTVAYLPDISESGEVIGWVASIVDITARKNAEKAMRDSEERFRLATEAVQAVIYDWNILEDTIVRSGEIERLLGFGR